MESALKPTIGVLAIQGAVQEHLDCVRRAGAHSVEIKLASDITNLDGIILPGGESTAMAIVGEKWGIFPVLKDWVASGQPIWGTCAGMILLSNTAIMQKSGGQALIGGLDVKVCRNYFGPQIHSQKMSIEVPFIERNNENSKSDSSESTGSNCDAVFIRAPAILTAGPSVQVMAKINATPCIKALDEVRQVLEPSSDSEPSSKRQKVEDIGESADCPSRHEEDSDQDKKYEVIVAVRQGNILATAFHPELTDDLRWHHYFLQMVREKKNLQHV